LPVVPKDPQNIMLKKSIILHLLALLFMASMANAQGQSKPKELKTIIVFFDGLRPDYITPEAMPNLYEFIGIFNRQLSGQNRLNGQYGIFSGSG